MESNKTVHGSLGTAGMTVLVLIIGFVLGFVTERQLVQSGASNPIVGESAPPEGVDFSAVWKAWNVLDTKFVPAAVASTTDVASTTEGMQAERIWGMIQGLALSVGDPYTFFMPPQESKDFSQDMSGTFEGVGMEVAVKDQQLVVVSPLKGTPAEKAGMKPDDKILKIDGADTKGLDVSAAVSKIRGPKGTVVTLLVSREGWGEPREVKVTRDKIDVPIVNTEVSEEVKKIDSSVFVISLASFTSNSPELFRSSLREFVESGKTKLVLDLRGNPGGYLEAAVDMASWFLPAGKVIVTEDYDGHQANVVHRSLGYDIFSDNLKMAILIDKGSASASEILADALRHYNVGKLIGTNSFGKGSVQELVPITPETSLKVTVARWLGPDGKQIPLDGIAPDIMSTTSEEFIKEKRDVQMEAAIKYLNSL